MKRSSRTQGRRPRAHFWLVAAAAILAVVLVSTRTVLAGQTVSQDKFTLGRDEVITDDLYVTAEEIVIDGKVEGDVVAFGAYIEINGEVTEDLVAAGGGITLNGVVGDDAYLAGGGVTVNGSVGDDLLLAAGGSALPGMPAFPMMVGGREIQQGATLTEESLVGGDLYAFGGAATYDGRVVGNVYSLMAETSFGGQVGGNATLFGDVLTVSDDAQVGGTLTYSADATSGAPIPAGVAAEEAPVAPPAPPQPSMAQLLTAWLIRVGRTLLGLLVLGWLLLTLAPRLMRSTVALMEHEAGTTIGYGILFAFAAVPVAFIFVILAGLFWGVAPGMLATAMLLFGALGVLWFASPAITGWWLGRRLLRNSNSELAKLLVGAVMIILVVRVLDWLPLFGGLLSWLVMVASFVFAAGSLLRARTAGRYLDAPATPPAPPLAPPPAV